MSRDCEERLGEEAERADELDGQLIEARQDVETLKQEIAQLKQQLALHENPRP